MVISKAEAKRQLFVGRRARLVHSLLGPTQDGKGLRAVKAHRSKDIVMSNYDKLDANNQPCDSYLTMQGDTVTLEGNILTFWASNSPDGTPRIQARYELLS